MFRTSFTSFHTCFPLSLSIDVFIFLSFFFHHFNVCKGLLATGCIQVLSVYFNLLYPFLASTICDLLLAFSFSIWHELQNQYQKEGMGLINRPRIPKYFCRIISKQSKNQYSSHVFFYYMY